MNQAQEDLEVQEAEEVTMALLGLKEIRASRDRQVLAVKSVRKAKRDQEDLLDYRDPLAVMEKTANLGQQESVGHR